MLIYSCQFLTLQYESVFSCPADLASCSWSRSGVSFWTHFCATGAIRNAWTLFSLGVGNWGGRLTVGPIIQVPELYHRGIIKTPARINQTCKFSFPSLMHIVNIDTNGDRHWGHIPNTSLWCILCVHVR